MCQVPQLKHCCFRFKQLTVLCRNFVLSTAPPGTGSLTLRWGSWRTTLSLFTTLLVAVENKLHGNYHLGKASLYAAAVSDIYFINQMCALAWPLAARISKSNPNLIHATCSLFIFLMRKCPRGQLDNWFLGELRSCFKGLIYQIQSIGLLPSAEVSNSEFEFTHFMGQWRMLFLEVGTLWLFLPNQSHLQKHKQGNKTKNKTQCRRSRLLFIVVTSQWSLTLKRRMCFSSSFVINSLLYAKSLLVSVV